MFTLMTGMRERHDDVGSGFSALMVTLKQDQKSLYLIVLCFQSVQFNWVCAGMTKAFFCANAANRFLDKRQNRERLSAALLIYHVSKEPADSCLFAVLLKPKLVH